jgi:hypothetical protein
MITMNKKVLTVCALASIALAVFSCSKKDDDSSTTATTATTSTTATTATTATTSTTSQPVLPTPGENQMAIDTELVDYQVQTCMSITQGRFQLKGNMSNSINSTVYATFGKSPNFSSEMDIVTGLPPINSSTQIQLTASIDAIDYVAQSGKVTVFKTQDSSGVQFTKIKFKGSNDSTKTISGFLKCP